MAHVVIIGASTGGLPAAYEMKEALGREHEVTVVSNVENFHFVPSNPWVAVGWRKRAQISFPLAKPLTRKGIRFVPVAVEEIQADSNRLRLANGETLDYDYLVIATGPRLAFDEVEGLGPFGGFTHSVCTVDHAEQANEAFEAFCKDPGPIVVGAVQMASCFGPAYEFACMLDTELRRRKIRNQVPMTFVTSEPYVGHMGLGGVGDSKGLLEHELRERHINWVTNAKVSKIEADKMHVEVVDGEDREVPFKFAMMLPAFKGVEAVAKVEGLCNPRGFVLVDKFQRNPKHANIFALGVCVAIPPVEATPVPTGAPKTGFMIETMATAVVHNVRHAIRGEEPEAVPTWNALCLADFGDTGAAFIASPQMPPRNRQWTSHGRWVHVAKAVFERYFIHKMKRGDTDPLYERVARKWMGVEKLMH
jgi:sulfide:quinone oxidoreductase